MKRPLPLRVSGQNTPYMRVCVCDCSQQTELREINTPRLLHRMCNRNIKAPKLRREWKKI